MSRFGRARPNRNILSRAPLSQPVAAALDGSAIVAITTSGDLTTAIQMTGSSTVAVTASGDLTTAIQMTGSSTVAVTASGDLTTAIQMTGSSSVAVTASGDLPTAIQMTGSSSVAVTTSGDLTTAIPLTGSSDIAITAAAELTTAIQMTGSSTVAVTASGDLTTAIQLTGSSDIAITAAAELEIGIQFTAASTVAVTASGDLTTAIQLTGSSNVAVTATGDLTTAILLTASSTVAITISGDLTTAIQLTGASTVAITTSGDLTTAIQLTGTATVSIAATGVLRSQYTQLSPTAVSGRRYGTFAGKTLADNSIVGSSTLTITASGELTTAIQLVASSAIAVTAAGELTTAIQMTGSVIVAVTASGDLTTAIQMTAAPTVVITTSGDLTTAIQLTGSASVVFTTAVDFDTYIPLTAGANIAINTTGVLSAAFVIHPYGRQGIWYGQSQSGLDYPLVAPSPDVRYLLADVYLSYDDPSDYSTDPEFSQPFSIYWLSGFGDDAAEVFVPDSEDSESSSAADAAPVPTNTRDIIIRDATGREVFNSTAAGVVYVDREWTDWLSITSWHLASGETCSVVHYTAWDSVWWSTPQSYSEYLFPDSAVLQDPTVYRLPRRVRSLTAILDVLTAQHVAFSGSYNMQLTADVAVPALGGRRINGITFDATPGAGIGVYPECEPDALAITKINEVPPTSTGQFFFNADGCYYARQPVRLLSETPRLLLPEVQLSPGSTVEDAELMPDETAGTSTTAIGWPADIQYAHLQIGNDCGACCSCDDYVAVAEYIQQQHAKYAALGSSFSATRDTYHANRTRWLASRTVLQQYPVRIAVLAQRCPYVDIGVQVCNQTATDMVDILVTVTMSTSPSGGAVTLQDGYSYITAPVIESGIQRVRTQRASIDVLGVVFSTNIVALPAGSSGIVRFRLGVSDCGEPIIGTGYQVIAEAAAYVDDVMLGSESVIDSDILNCPTVVTTPPDDCIGC